MSSSATQRTPGSGSTSAPSKPAKIININTATHEQLCTIPGIGESRAIAIINYRTQQTALHQASTTTSDSSNSSKSSGITVKKKAYKVFKTLQDLSKVQGISATVIENIAPYVDTKNASSKPKPTTTTTAAAAAVATTIAVSAVAEAAATSTTKPCKASKPTTSATPINATTSKPKASTATASSTTTTTTKPKPTKPPPSATTTTTTTTATTSTLSKLKITSSEQTPPKSSSSSSKARKPVKVRKTPSVIKIASWNVKNLSLNTDLRRFSRVAITIARYLD
jgi:hypothetical protein